ncbi:MAG: glycosyltransferase [Desulfobacterales bacterium]|nr:glycosyltransferase [Desulfobacterales bacterium]
MYLYSCSQDHYQVSVVIRTCNRPYSLLQAIDSVNAQTFSNIEIIIVNDGDILPALNNSLKKSIRIIEPINKRNRSAAANIGWQNAQGNFICFLDDDDLFTPDHIQTLLFQLEMHPWYSVCYSGVLITFPDRRKQRLWVNPFDIARLLKENFIPIHSVLIRKEVLTAVNGFDETVDMFEDWDLWLRMAEKGFSFLPVKAWTAIYRQHEDGTLNQAGFGSDKDISARLKVISKHESMIRNYLEKQGLSGRIKVRLRTWLFKIAKELLC